MSDEELTPPHTDFLANIEKGGALVSAGGWCAPSDVLYDAAALHEDAVYTTIGLPSAVQFKALRPGTPEWDERQRRNEVQRAVEADTQHLVRRLVGSITQAQDRILVLAYAVAIEDGLDIHIEDPPYGHTMWRWNTSGDLAAYWYIGVSLAERPDTLERRLQGDRPIIVRSRATDRWIDVWEDEWDD